MKNIFATGILKTMEWIYELKQIKVLARKWWKAAEGYRIFAFHGGMGAGKTTLIHALCGEKGVTEPVTSPTFSLVNEYRYRQNEEEKTIFHIDLYRVKDEEEAIRAGIEDCLLSGAVCFVEWPGKAPHIFPEETVHVFIEQIDDKTRRIKIQFPDVIL
jgi:tRNA threonylcarbamoyladenosine biosynthesis protein TsaE